jgi:hypothetical protein
MRLDVDAAGLEADQGVSNGSREHVATLDTKVRRVGDARVTKA